MSGAYVPQTPLGRAIDWVEETMIALLLGAMTLITFANVIARYVFNDNILWALEATLFLFAWLVLLGAGYCVKITAHLGVDVLVNALSPAGKRAMAWASLACCLVFSILLFVGSWNLWAPFAALPELDGNLRDQAWYEVDDIPMPVFLRFLEDWMNQGEEYEKMPRFIPYFVLPLSAAILLLRFVEAGWRIALGRQAMLIVSHEVEDQIGEAPRGGADGLDAIRGRPDLSKAEAR
ncbi:MAG: TRAP transporter small permease [Pseudomonadota bacterium]